MSKHLVRDPLFRPPLTAKGGIAGRSFRNSVVEVLSIQLAAFGLAGGILVAGLIGMLSNIDAECPIELEESLAIGHFHAALVSRYFWERLPSHLLMFVQLDVIGHCFDISALGFAAMSAVVLYLVLRKRMRFPLCVVGLLVAISSFIPYVVGLFVVQWISNPYEVGPVLPVMLLSLLYGFAACFLFSIVGWLSCVRCPLSPQK